MGTRSHTPLVTFARRAGRRVLVAVASAPSTIGWTGLVVLAVLIVAAYLRLKGVSWGLPYNYQDPDEKVVLLHAFRIARGHLNPEFFYYPSMLFTMIGSVTWLVSRFYAPHGVTLISSVTFVTNPTPYYLIGRTVVAACGVTSVYLVYRLGREAFSRPVGLLAALFLAVEPLHVRYSHVAVTDVPATMFGLLALLLFLRASRKRDARTLLCGALAAGLATGTKYNLGMLLVPGVVACWYVYRDQPAAHRASALAARALRRVAAPMLLAFVISTPFAVLDPRHFLGDFYRQNQIVAHGWLGFENVHSGYWYNLSVNLVGSLGVVLLALGLAGLVLALAKRTRADCIIVSFVITYYLYVSSWHELMDRYLLPIVPLLIVLAVRACLALAAVPVVRRRAVVVTVAAALLLGAIVLPARASIIYSRSLSGTDVRTIAMVWLERHLPASAVIAMEPYGPPLVARLEQRYYTAASLTTPTYRIYQLPLPLPGVRDPRARLRFLLTHRVGYVVLSSEVDSRVLAARATYPGQVAFYEELHRHGRLIATFSPRPGEQGPVITVYRLPPTPMRAAPRGARS
ncbi:MAG: glycosyltransferase family 39 protein [Thermoleophilia bacterium]